MARIFGDKPNKQKNHTQQVQTGDRKDKKRERSEVGQTEVSADF